MSRCEPSPLRAITTTTPTITATMMAMMMLTTIFCEVAQASPVVTGEITSGEVIPGEINSGEIIPDAKPLGEGETDERSPKSRDKRETFDMVDFLTNYGYLAPPEATYEGKFQSDDVFNIAIRDFQRFNGLKETGIPDDETVELMKRPRCGMPDIIRDPYRDYSNNNNDDKNVNIPMAFTTFGTRWHKDTVTWKTTKFSKNLSKGQQWRALQKALDVWEREIPLKFRYTDSNPDIEILFAEGDHGDGFRNRFRGKGGVLAHAYGPGRGIGGDTHFDDSEEWLVDDSDPNTPGTDLVTVAAHEFGHALGLGHSKVRSSLMAPYYRRFDKLELQEDDILGITEIYGRKQPEPTIRPVIPTTTTTTTARPTTTTTPTATAAPTTTTTPRPATSSTRPQTTTLRTTKSTPLTRPTTDEPWMPAFCSRSFRLDAISAGPNSRWFAYRRENIYEVGPRGLTFGYPKRIRQVFPGAPVKNVRAVTYVPETRQTYIFKYSYVWRFTDFSLDAGYPRIWTLDYRFRPSAALTLTYNGVSQIFMFGHDNFWEFNINTETVTPGYPLSLSTYFPFAPMLPDAAMTTANGHFVFFKYNRFKNLPSRGRNARSQLIGPNVFGNVCGQRPADFLWESFQDDQFSASDEARGFESDSTSSFEAREWPGESPPMVRIRVTSSEATESGPTDRRDNYTGSRSRRHHRRSHGRGHRREHGRDVNWHLGQGSWRMATSYRRG